KRVSRARGARNRARGRRQAQPVINNGEQIEATAVEPAPIEQPAFRSCLETSLGCRALLELRPCVAGVSTRKVDQVVDRWRCGSQSRSLGRQSLSVPWM